MSRTSPSARRMMYGCGREERCVLCKWCECRVQAGLRLTVRGCVDLALWSLVKFSKMEEVELFGGVR